MIELNLDKTQLVEFTPAPIILDPDLVLAFGCPLGDEHSEVEHGT